MLTKKGHHFSR